MKTIHMGTGNTSVALNAGKSNESVPAALPAVSASAPPNLHSSLGQGMERSGRDACQRKIPTEVHEGLLKNLNFL